MAQHKTISPLHMKQCTHTWYSTRQSHRHGTAQDNHTAPHKMMYKDMVHYKTITLLHVKQCTQTWYSTRQSYRHGTAQDNHAAPNQTVYTDTVQCSFMLHPEHMNTVKGNTETMYTDMVLHKTISSCSTYLADDFLCNHYEILLCAHVT